MIRQVRKYLQKMATDGSASVDHSLILAKDDCLLWQGSAELLPLGQTLIERLNIISLVVAEPPLPICDVLLGRTSADAAEIIPQDTETRTFLHDIPVVRKDEFSVDNAQSIVDLLGQRKGILVEGVGIVATGSVTVEQAYINYSSVYHALFVKLMLQLLADDQPPSAQEMNLLQPLWAQLGTDIPLHCDDLLAGPLLEKADILKAIDQVGKRTVALKLVDSFFGNISCFVDDSLYISQTGASLDELPGCIDFVPNDNSSTAGITASSELIAHRAIFAKGNLRTILHGHPKFSVVLSLFCRETDCKITDCWKNCDKVRYLNDVPVVAGEVGAGGLARKVPPVIDCGIAVVYGHGVFATGDEDFRQPLSAMIDLENRCRNEFLQAVQARCTNETK
ncbi:Ribulose-5-phosphate 4-epimerase/Fuculose-1-phosphate aldolase [Malonomonas rubra DSM 5091]|uniref:Ribulose-5-phosphate 4-epimerase/Fuculose-1-phosphate aldolase n=1 Tax=Malonomonas rubra DSM 5091 TaxID=1122189 RepID=A0A1M6BGW2_MALRU|nr:class II aldolase/adducin family protein [Malonomonas rubra]SHI47949.1 Ribulose-5-phosphate 4-epimerase/Fuculose-1-phosphate aldolase [Malonomonas rubra DSM 5091]